MDTEILCSDSTTVCQVYRGNHLVIIQFVLKTFEPYCIHGDLSVPLEKCNKN